MKTSIDIRSLLSSLGIKGDDRGREFYAPCPNAAAHDGGRDVNPSWRIVIDRDDPRYGRHYCHPCGFGGGPVSLLRFFQGCSAQEAKQRLGLIGGLDPNQTDKEWLAWRLNSGHGSGTALIDGPELELPPGAEWLDHHSQLPHLAQRYWKWKVGTDPTGPWGPISWGCAYASWGRLAGRVVLPVRTGGRLLGYSARAIDYRGLIQDSIPGDWPNHQGKVVKERFSAEREDWIRALTRRSQGRLTRSQRALIQDTRTWLETITRWPGLRYLTPRKTRGSQGQEPEPGTDIESGLMFWDRIFPVDPTHVTLVEGGIKAIRAATAGWASPVAITGASGLTPARRALLQTANRIDVIADPDPAGRAFAERVRSECGSRLTEVEIHDFGAPVDKIPIRRLAELRPVS